MRRKKNKAERVKVRSSLGYRRGFNQGFNSGYDTGFDHGFEVGVHQVRDVFEGSSIIIPTYNKLEYLKQCIESIQTHTDPPYELILVDNGSNDGTIEYVKSLKGRVRIQLNQENLGFSGAVNQGLALAQGTTLVVLNNDAVVTSNWLSNLLLCVQSDPSIGIVGPVTNYISGDQLIDVPYHDIADMQSFAHDYNHSDPNRWVETSRLTGFCMMMRRDVFERLGYFDEGFEIGNCEDDDYGLRSRIAGFRLMIAKDTFIHHYGSVSMKLLLSDFDQVYKKNLAYYSSKWGKPQLVLDNVKTSGAPYRMIDFYPTHIAVKGSSTRLYWIENGVKYLLETSGEVHAVHISEVDLMNWPEGGSITDEEYSRKLANLRNVSREKTMLEGMLLKAPNEQIYQLQGNKIHRMVSDQTLVTWFNRNRSIIPVDWNVVKEQYVEGNPIISPIVIKATNL